MPLFLQINGYLQFELIQTVSFPLRFPTCHKQELNFESRFQMLLVDSILLLFDINSSSQFESELT
eukprot:m.50411 g.50411  ORF g.50411 m.50411 type:complete len:65 (-) comp21293_c0_seq2:288-482(-)